MRTAVVITTINAPTTGVREIAAGLHGTGNILIIVGDRKTPTDWRCDGSIFMSVEDQAASPFALTAVLPENTYARKMAGYLNAANAGVHWIRETDDDNRPYASFLEPAAAHVEAILPSEPSRWVNPYQYFTNRPMWPRGFPLAEIRTSLEKRPSSGPAERINGLVVLQGLADGDPDVDAIYRLSAPDVSDVTFEQRPNVVIPRGSWAPFNSQVTTWPIELLPLMYLPTTCSFRMTDIWRSFIAQRLMWELEAHIVFTCAQVFQERNAHDLGRDFSDEVEGYLGYERFVTVLEGLELVPGPIGILSNLERAYSRLTEEGFFHASEMPLVEAWISDMQRFGFGHTA
jgi:hypothetical protein